MAEYLRPGVFVEDNAAMPSIAGVSTSTGGFVGLTQRGKVNEAVFCGSWDDYLRNFSQGMDSPFIASSDLAYSVYGFFQNGGRRCYVVRQAVSAKKAEASSLFIAKDEGVWGNRLEVTVSENDDTTVALPQFDIHIKLGTEVVEVFSGVTDVENTADYWADAIERSSFVSSVLPGKLDDLGVTTGSPVVVSFTGGLDGTTVTDADFVSALKAFDVIDDVNLISIPGQTTAAVINGVLAYAEARTDVFALIDAPKASTVSSLRDLRRTITCKNGALYTPWIRVTDPLSLTGRLRTVPSAGHVMGVYARIINSRGIWKAPAGTEANILGALEVVTIFNNDDLNVLNPAGINAIVPKKNYGIVVWGARSLHPDSRMKYVSTVLLDIFIKKSIYEGTQQFVFEPNGERTWGKLTTVVEAFLNGIWRSGGLKGATAAEAYRVRCDADVNPPESIDEGKLICEVSYAPLKPAEFVIFRFSHTLSQA